MFLCFIFFAVISVCLVFFILKNRCEPEIFPVFFFFFQLQVVVCIVPNTAFEYVLFFQNVWILKTMFCPCVNLRAEFQIY